MATLMTSPVPLDHEMDHEFDVAADSRLLELIHESEPYAVQSDQVANLWRTIAMQMKNHFDQHATVSVREQHDSETTTDSCRVSPRMCQNRFKSLLLQHDKQLVDANMTYCIVSKHLSLEEQHLQKLLSQISNRMYRSSNSNLARSSAAGKTTKRKSMVSTTPHSPAASAPMNSIFTDLNPTNDNWKMLVDMEELDREVDPTQIQQLSEHLEGVVNALRAYISIKKINDYPRSSSSSLAMAGEEEEEKDLEEEDLEDDVVDMKQDQQQETILKEEDTSQSGVRNIPMKDNNDSYNFTVEAMESAEKMCNDLLQQ